MVTIPESVAKHEQVQRFKTPISLTYDYTPGAALSSYLRGMAEGKLIGHRDDDTGKVYVPPRGVSPVTGKKTHEIVEVKSAGVITTFNVTNLPIPGKDVELPYVCAWIRPDGADTTLMHIIQGCDPSEVRMGMRVEAVWKPQEEWTTSAENIMHWTPTGEDDADYESYRQFV